MRAGFIALTGRPNVGKSTLINKLVKEKIAIVSNKPQTTRDRIRGIVNRRESQFIFVDTPGIHKPKHMLGEHMTDLAIKTLKDVEVVAMILDGTEEIGKGDQFVFERIKESKVPRIAVINKFDKITDEELEAKKVEIAEKLGEFDNIISISAEYGMRIDKFLNILEPYLDEDAMYYPEDMYTDMPLYKMISETVREKILLNTEEEIPHSVAIEITNVERKEDAKDRYEINIYIERDSQKGIIIGKGGSMLKKIGSEARMDIERLLDKKIFLALRVKVKEKWRKKKPFLKDLGYFIEE